MSYDPALYMNLRSRFVSHPLEVVECVSNISILRQHVKVGATGTRMRDVLVDVASTLHTLVHPFAAILFLVDWDRECLTSAVRLSVDECDLKLVWMVGERVSATHASRSSSNDQHAFLLFQLGHDCLVDIVNRDERWEDMHDEGTMDAWLM